MDRSSAGPANTSRRRLSRWQARLLVLALAATLTVPSASATADDPDLVMLSGTLAVTWGDGPPGSGVSARARYALFTDDGSVWGLRLERPDDAATLSHAERVVVTGWSRGATVDVTALTRLAERGHQIIGSQPWVTLPCKFADVAAEPQDYAHFQGLLSSSEPGLDHYWREASYDAADLIGSSTRDWAALPGDRAAYFANGDVNDEVLRDELAQDCAAAHDPAVDFSQFVGLNMMFNDNLDCCAWGGGTTVTTDEGTAFMRATWNPPWAYQTMGIVAHEMGHGFGLLHSSGPYGLVYDSQWDLMSGGASPFPVHPISWHKDRLGWIPSGRMYVADDTANQVIALERLALPGGSDYLMAEIPFGTSSFVYTVETRRFAGYDSGAPANIPGEGVIIHKADPVALVVDGTVNGDPNDDGAMWIPGEAFVDPAHEITVDVLLGTATAFVISITRGHDNFVNARELDLAADTATSTNVGAGAEPGEPTHGAAGTPAASVWWTFTSPVDGFAHVDTFGSTFDTALAAYTGPTVAELTQLAANDDTGSPQSAIDFPVSIGVEYRVAVDGAAGATGDITLNYVLSEIDYGDAPDPPYPTLTASDGARHPIVSGFHMGASVGGEPDGQPTPGADGDDLNGADDEDGVTFTTEVRGGLPATVEVVASGPGGFLNAWIDFNADGDWLDAGEQIATNLALVGGPNAVAFDVPAAAAAGITFARFRYDSVGGLAPTGIATDGEVEDHPVAIQPALYCDGLLAEIVGTLANDLLLGGPGDDVIVGRAGDDVIDGGAGNDTICAGAGSDTIVGGPGDDHLDGQQGADTVDFSAAPGAVSVNLQLRRATGGHGTDDVIGVEHIVGSPFADTLRGNAKRNIINGGAGDDGIQGLGGHDELYGEAGDDNLNGRRGDDIIHGGPGIDQATFAHAPGNTNVNLVLTLPQPTGDGVDWLISIENVFGSRFHDNIIGNGQANVLKGAKGNDVLTGRGGNDILLGNKGTDFADGGGGTDTCRAETTVACE